MVRPPTDRQVRRSGPSLSAVTAGSDTSRRRATGRMIRAFSRSSGVASAGSDGLRFCPSVPFASTSACSSLSNMMCASYRSLRLSRQYCSGTTRAIRRRTNSCMNRCMTLTHRQQTQSQQRRFLVAGTGHTRRRGRGRKERRASKRQDRSSTESERKRNAAVQRLAGQNSRSGSSTSRRTLAPGSVLGRFFMALPDRSRVKSISWRVPPLVLLLYGAMFSSDHHQYGYDYGISPGRVAMGLGSSMIPTILPRDVVLFECISYRLLPDVLRRELQVGDVVIYVVDKEKGFFGARYITKRIVATGGMEVDRRGQHADLFGDRSNYGILPDSNDTQEMVEDDEYVTRYGRQVDAAIGEKKEMVTVPEGHLWLEGDNPVYSIDSRQYGPIAITSVRGRVVARLFPWSRASSDGAERQQKENGGKQGSGFGFFGLNRPEPPPLDDLAREKLETFFAGASNGEGGDGGGSGSGA